MKKLFLFAAVILSTTLFAQNGNPQISSVEKNFDFGQIVEGDIVAHNFEIENKGDAPLTINRVKASCGCTAVAPSKNILEPGESTLINVKFNSAHRRGEQRKHVYIFSNDPKSPELRLSFTATILPKDAPQVSDIKKPDLKLSKYYFDFGNVKQGTELNLEVIVRSTGGETVKIQKVVSTSTSVSAYSTKQNLLPGETGTLKIKFDTSAKSGKMSRTVTVYSNDPDEPQQTITLFANIQKK